MWGEVVMGIGVVWDGCSCILGDPGADSGDEEKSKRAGQWAEKYMA